MASTSGDAGSVLQQVSKRELAQQAEVSSCLQRLRPGTKPFAARILAFEIRDKAFTDQTGGSISALNHLADSLFARATAAEGACAAACALVAEILVQNLPSYKPPQSLHCGATKPVSFRAVLLTRLQAGFTESIGSGSSSLVGMASFIGHMLRHDLLTERIVLGCLSQLGGAALAVDAQPPAADAPASAVPPHLEAACRLLDLAGKQLSASAVAAHREALGGHLTRLRAWQGHPTLAPAQREAIDVLLRHQAEGWHAAQGSGKDDAPAGPSSSSPPTTGSPSPSISPSPSSLLDLLTTGTGASDSAEKGAAAAASSSADGGASSLGEMLACLTPANYAAAQALLLKLPAAAAAAASSSARASSGGSAGATPSNGNGPEGNAACSSPSPSPSPSPSAAAPAAPALLPLATLEALADCILRGALAAKDAPSTALYARLVADVSPSLPPASTAPCTTAHGSGEAMPAWSPAASAALPSPRGSGPSSSPSCPSTPTPSTPTPFATANASVSGDGQGPEGASGSASGGTSGVPEAPPPPASPAPKVTLRRLLLTSLQVEFGRMLEGLSTSSTTSNSNGSTPSTPSAPGAASPAAGSSGRLPSSSTPASPSPSTPAAAAAAAVSPSGQWKDEQATPLRASSGSGAQSPLARAQAVVRVVVAMLTYGLLTEKIVMACAGMLLERAAAVPPSHACLDCLCALLSATGKLFDGAADANVRSSFASLLGRLERLYYGTSLSEEGRARVQALLDLRASGRACHPHQLVCHRLNAMDQLARKRPAEELETQDAPTHRLNAEDLRAQLLGRGPKVARPNNNAGTAPQQPVNAPVAVGEDDDLADLPSDVEVALISLRHEFRSVASCITLPPLATRSQLYATMKDHTQVDRELDEARLANHVRLFKMATGLDDVGILETDEYVKRVMAAAQQHDDEAHTAATAGGGSSSSGGGKQQRPFHAAAQALVHHVLPKHTEMIISYDQFMRLLKGVTKGSPAGASSTSSSASAAPCDPDRIVTMLLNMTCIARNPHHQDGYMFCVPGLGPLIKAITSGRKELLAWLGKRKYAEAREVDALKLKLRAPCVTGARYVLRDLVGRGEVVVLNMPAGRYVKLAASQR